MPETCYFPMFVNLNQCRALVIGQGKIARHKKEMLERYGANVSMLPDISQEELKDWKLVICASAENSRNRRIADWCALKKIPCNVVDDKEASSFIFGSMIQSGLLSIGISTSGASPAAARYLKKEIQNQLSPDWPQRLDQLERSRQIVKSLVLSQPERALLFEELFELALNGRFPENVEEWVRRHG